MARSHDKGVRSRAHLFGHPLHPMLIPFPIAFLVGALVTDLVYWGTGDAFWAGTSMWLITAGFATALVAALPGMVDFAALDRVRAHAMGWIHAVSNLVVMGFALANMVLRWTMPDAVVVGAGLILSICTVVVLGVAGWAGGTLVYRHKIGVIDAESAEAEEREAQTEAQKAKAREAERRRAA